MKAKFLFTVGLIFLSVLAFSQDFYQKQANDIVKDSRYVRLDESTKTVKYVEFTSNAFIGQKTSQAAGFLQSSLKLKDGYLFIKTQEKTDKAGYTHIKYQQYYQKIQVDNKYFTLHFKDGILLSGSGEYINTEAMVSSPSITYDQAFQAAINHINAKKYIWEDDYSFDKSKLGQLVIVYQNGKTTLAYKFDIYAQEPMSRDWVYVDAITGKIIKTETRIYVEDRIGIAETMYNGTRNITTDSISGYYRLREYGRGGGIETYDLNNGTSYGSAVDFTDADNYWDVTANWDNAAYDAHLGTEATYDYYLNEHGRNSFDDAGATMISYVHYSSGYVNAFWNGSFMTYGDGDGVNYFPLTCVDIVAHETTHGVTDYSADLIYSYESGALNESFSDIFGTCVDFYLNPGTANWILGEQISATGTPIRSMENPNSQDQPDTYLGYLWYTGSSDNGGVHTNSGVMNFWFYLLVNGSSGVNDNGDSYSVTGIGIDKAARIAYRNLTVYLTPTSQYADARFYAIQAATDLYGDCSQEVISVTNAWYAVGVGDVYDNSVIADFSVSQNFSCTYPVDITFYNQSINGSTYEWYFGDGGTSTDSIPTHTYTAPGIYDVTFIVNGSALCNNTDTLIREDYINITDIGGPKSPSCTPGTINPGSYGIRRFVFNTIENESDPSIEGYQDNSCSFITTITEGKAYPIEILTHETSAENVYVWLDLDSNGVFSSDEQIYSSINKTGLHEDTIIIPKGSAYNTPIRLRVGSDRFPNTLTSCTQSQYGQFEDYSVILIENNTAPEADFISDLQSIETGGSVQFTNRSLNTPTTWEWHFPGGAPATSTEQNPMVVYAFTGIYDVTLIVTNAYGSDTIVKTGYIAVSNTYIMCTDAGSSAVSGILYDSGGPLGEYDDGENCSFLIDPGCANYITLSFNAFYLEGCCDYFRVYDGSDASGTLLLSANGSTIPSPVTATSGTMYITFTSDGSVTYAGFESVWTADIDTSGPDPVADFTISNDNPPYNTEVSFTDQTTQNPNGWIWNFGDGTYSGEQNPIHTYSTSGLKEVTLIAFACTGTDTVQKSLIVQGPPSIAVTPDSIEVALFTGDSIAQTITINNTSGSGDLVFTVSAANFEQASIIAQNRKSVISTSSVVISKEYAYTQDITGRFSRPAAEFMPNEAKASDDASVLIIHHNSDVSEIVTELSAYPDLTVYTWDELVGTPSITDLSVYNVVLVGTNGPWSDATQLGNVLADYVDAGGKVVTTVPTTYSGSSYAISGRLYNEGYMPFEMASSVGSGSLGWYDASHPIMENVSIAECDLILEDQTISAGAELIASFSGGGAFVAVKEDVVGINVFLGASGYWYGDIPLIIYNTINSFSDKWINTENLGDTVPAGSSTTVDIWFNASGLYGGDYYADVVIESNDSINPIVNIPTHMKVTGVPLIEASTDTVNFGIQFVGQVINDSIEITNTGTDQLIIDSIRVSNNIFTVTPFGSLTIAPTEEAMITVTYSPASVQVDNGVMTIYSNANNDASLDVVLTGEGVLPPVISVSPDSLSDDLLTGDSVMHTLTIDNTTGGSNLNFNIDVENNIFVSTIIQKLSPQIGFYADMTRYNNVSDAALPHSVTGLSFNGIIGDILGTYEFPDYSTGMVWVDEFLYIVNYGDYSVDQYDLATEQVINSFLIHSDPYGIAYDGTYLWIGDYSGNVYGYDLSGNLVGSFSTPINYYFALTWDGTCFVVTEAWGYNADIYKIDYAGNIIETYTSDYNGTTSQFVWVPDHTDGNLWVNDYDYTMIRQLNLEAGTASQVSAFSFYDDSYTYSIAHNGTDLWYADWDGPLYQLDDGITEMPTWLNFNMVQGNIPAGSSQNIDVKFDATGLYGGDYYADIVVSSNDPVTPEVIVPAHLHVTGVPLIETSSDTVNFGIQFIGAVIYDSIWIINTGTDQLVVDSIRTNNSIFAVIPTGSITIAPEQEEVVFITYSPASVQIDNGVMTLYSNANNDASLDVVLTGEGVLPPVISVTPDSLSENLFTGDSIVRTLTIDNTAGGSVLNFELSLDNFTQSTFSIMNLIENIRAEILSMDENSIEYKVSGENEEDGQAVKFENQSIAPLTGDLTGINVMFISSSWSGFSIELEARGATTSVYTGSLDATILEDVNVLVISDSYYPSSAEMSIVNKWISDGGSIIVDADNNQSTYNTIILGSGITYTSTYCTYGTTSDITAHDLTENITSYLIGSSAQASLTITGDAISLIRDSYARNYCAYGVLGDGHVLAICDESLQSSYTNTGHLQLGINAVEYLAKSGGRWLRVDTYEGSVAAGSSMDISVTLDATGLYGGDYYADINITSNDPVTPEVIVPAHLHVTGVPLIETSSDTVNFGVQFIGAVIYDSIWITNTGTDQLVIDSIRTNNSIFAVIPTGSITIAPEQEEVVFITYSPASVQIDNGVMTLYSNANNDASLDVVLTGEGVLPPVISVTPTSFSENLYSGDSVVRMLTIDNTAGGSDLVFNIDLANFEQSMSLTYNNIIKPEVKKSIIDACRISGNKQYDTNDELIKPVLLNEYNLKAKSLSKSVLIFRDNLAWGCNANVPLLENLGAVVSIAPSDSMDYVDLSQFDVILFESQQSSSFYTAYLNNLSRFESYLNGGGYIEFHTATYTSYRYSNLPFPGGMQTLTYDDVDSYNYVADSMHPIASNVDYELYGTSASHEAFENVPAGARIITINESGLPTTVEYKVGSGTLLVTGMTWEHAYTYGYNSGDLLPNALQYSLDESGNSWLSVEVNTHVVPAGSSMNVPVTFNATGLMSGDYYADIIVTSNDPINSEIVVPALMHVTGSPNLETTDLVEFGSVFIGNAGYQSINISNTGTETLVIDTIVFDNPEFGMTYDTLTKNISPGGSLPVWLCYTPNASGYDTSGMTIYSNDASTPDFHITLIGEGVEGPELVVSTDTIKSLLLPGGSKDAILTISNIGDYLLNYSILMQDSDITWLSFIPEYGSVNPDDSINVNLHFNAAGLSAGEYPNTLYIWSNDPGAGGVNIPVLMSVRAQAPPVALPFADITTYTTADPVQISTSQLFEDPNEDTLTFGVSSTNLAVIFGTINQDILTLNQGNAGQSLITVTAADSYHTPVANTFTVSVLDNDIPIAKNIDNCTVDSGIVMTMNCDTIFTDPDEDEMEYSVTAADPSIANVAVVESALTITTLNYGSTSISITANDGKGGEAITSFTLVVSDDVAVPEMLVEGITFRIQPNPFKNTTSFVYYLESEADIEFRLYDLSGKLRKILINENQQMGENVIELNGESLEAGYYLVRMSVDNREVQFQKLIKF